MTGLTVVVAEGRLGRLVCERLSAAGEPYERVMHLTDGVPASSDLLLEVSDGWNPLLDVQAEEVCRQAGIPWLRGFMAFGQGVVGPLVRPGRPGCSQCADLRRWLAGNDRQEMWQFQQRSSSRELPSHPDAWASRSALSQLALLLTQLNALSVSRHFILPDPRCPVCGQAPEDSAEAARISLRPSPKAGEGSYRSRPMDELKDSLVRDYLDFGTGVLNGSMQDLTSPFADASVNLPLSSGDEGTAGRTHSFAESRLTAILEGLERYCGLSPRGKRTVVRDSYRNLQDAALNPASVGFHAREQYEQPDFPYRPFDPDEPTDWVWGYSFLTERPLLVPETLAFYGAGCGRGFVYETSNGCALGGSLEEAVFYGILEVVERDSFLMTWYAQLPLPRLDPYSSGDQELTLMLDRLKAVAGYEVLLFHSTMEHGIPSVWSAAKSTTGKGLHLICAAGAHPDPVRAVKSSVHELAGMLLTQNEKFEKNRDEYRRMLDDPFEVRQMEDHSMLYGLPEAASRFHFLFQKDRPLRSFEEQFARPAWRLDLTDDLKTLLTALRQVGLEVIVVDQTTPEILRNGLHCVKVIIPGTLPMTFGYRLTRLAGLDRVLTVPAALGYRNKPLTYEELNPHPHPFP
jgi:ribosomal protein S12 methylthiotransferase accessory factor